MAEEQDPAAAWEAALQAEESGSAPPQETRILNQDEIDSLLGFDARDEGDAHSGIKALIDKALNTYDRLPMLEVVFDRLVRMLSTSMRNFTSDNVDVSIDSITSLRFGDYLNSIPLPALLVVFKAIEWENFGIITVDGPLIYSVVDVLLGGRRSNRPIRIEGRPYTTIEQDIVKQLINVMLSDMGASFDPLSPVTFQFDRLETNPRFATIARPANAAILVRLRVDMEDRGGNIEIVFPYATLEPIKDLLLQMFMGEKFGRDSSWERSLGKEVKHANLQLEAVLDEKQLTLGDVMHFKVGTTVILNKSPDEDVLITCGGVPLLKGKLGRAGDGIAVRVSDFLFKNEAEES
ncbi:MAG: flagellar motor switch protein FliM [Alphaproteobacteria bacterium]|nr:flagellar motor switch protein FliM [Alphaproteobacteria bacterium]